MGYYDYDYSTSNSTKHRPIPQWVWLYCAISHFLAHTLDGIDGKQARRTGTSTPVGKGPESNAQGYINVAHKDILVHVPGDILMHAQGYTGT